MDGSPPPPPELEDLLAKVMGLPRSDIPEAADIKNTPRWDSVTQIELITALEAAYGVSFTISEIIAMHSLKAIREQLLKKGRA